MRTLRAVTALALILGAGRASAFDKWDTPSITDCEDDERVTCTELWHGARQTHDLQLENLFRDNDWMVAETKAGHSYEVRLVSSNLQLSTPLWSTAVTLKRWADVSELQSGSAPNGAGPVFGAATSLVLRWLADSVDDRREWIQVSAPSTPGGLTLTASDQYEVELLDTTYFASRWNQVGTQSSVFLVQNVSSAPVEGKIYFYDSDANLAFTQPFSIARNGLYVVSTGSLAPLAGKSGSAAVVHTGGYGALAGKVVSLEPATGFTFDTPLEPVSR